MPRDIAYREAEERIEAARVSGAKKLNLAGMGLTELPESLGQLIKLQTLDLSNNQLMSLPEWLSRLTSLKELDLESNQISSTPEWVWTLASLRKLHLLGNPLSELHPHRVNLPHLRHLCVGHTRSGVLPNWLRQLTNLEELVIHDSGLEELPEWLPELTKLQKIAFPKNRISSLPASILKLPHLQLLKLSDNPLEPELAAAHEKGLDAVKRYLKEMAKGGWDRYEAKLLILGDGDEGKTCISRALRGLQFRKQKSTRGVDVVQWIFPHPNEKANIKKNITLNIWDFEGQEISHQTHQFFLSSHSLYLLVFKCRDQFRMDRAEYWLDTIRARAPKAKVVIVISQCEERTPHIPLDRIKAQYSDMLATEWYFAVGCRSGKNIDELQDFLQRSAAGLKFMGSLWPQSYDEAESEIKAKAKANNTHISRTELKGILGKAGVNTDSYEDAADAMARLGVITQFQDCPDLRDFVVLNPQWLTKAISKVMEDKKLDDDKGEIALKRMEEIWNKARYPGMLATFHNCMKEFELCYDLEDHSDSCLVPLRFGYDAPTIPWTDATGIKVRRMEYKLNIRSPMGIMSRFIVKTHHMIVTTDTHPKGIYWHNGVFLRTASPGPSEALCEFVPDKWIFRVQVRAAFPQNMCEQIHGYIQAVFAFFDGLSAERSYGCIKVDPRSGTEGQCTGLHTEKRIYTAISKQRETLDCEFEDHEVDPRVLVSGISSFSGFIAEKFVEAMRVELDKPPEWATPFLRGVGALLMWVNSNSGKLDEVLQGQAKLAVAFKQEAELKLQEYLGCLSEMLDSRDQSGAPGLISIMTKDRSPWDPSKFFTKTYVLTPFCECEGKIHACEDARVEFTKDKAWWTNTAPKIACGTKLLAAGLQIAFAGMPLALGADAVKPVADKIKLMEALTKHLEVDTPAAESDRSCVATLLDGVSKDLRGTDPETALTKAALETLLEETAPLNYRTRTWGSLQRVRMSDNSYRWLCADCRPGQAKCPQQLDAIGTSSTA